MRDLTKLLGLYIVVVVAWVTSVVLFLVGLDGWGIFIQSMLATGSAVVSSQMVLFTWRRHQHEKTRRLLPSAIEARRNDDGTITAIVTRHNGDVTTLHLPEDYDPRRDDGRLVLEQLLSPDEFAKVVRSHVVSIEEEG